MFEHLQEHGRILVTGPQRSGTTIAARMIAADTGHRYLDEFNFEVRDVAQWRMCLHQDRIVVQCPHMLKDIVDAPPTGTFVVLMRRNLEDIHRSESRIGWDMEQGGNSAELSKFNVDQGDSAALKYAYWDSHKKDFPYLELAFESLQGNPLYVEAELRHHFGPKQVRL